MEVLACLILGTLFFLWTVHWFKKKAPEAKPQSPDPERVAKIAKKPDAPPKLRTTGRCFRDIVGESYCQEALQEIAGPGPHQELGFSAVAHLILQDDNQYDSNAVAVEIAGKLVGYLPRDEARLYRDRLKRAGLPLRTYQCPAAIVGGGRKQYGVWLDLPDRLA